MATDLGTVAQTFGLQNGLQQWKNDMADYVDKKRNLQYEPPRYKKVTHEFIKHQDVIYNPVTQKYNNPVHESKVTDFEKQNFIDVLAKNKVSRRLNI